MGLQARTQLLVPLSSASHLRLPTQSSVTSFPPLFSPSHSEV